MAENENLENEQMQVETQAPEKQEQETPTESIESLMAKINVLENANRKLKAQNDKMSSAEAERKRKEREQLTVEQQEAMQRMEAEEETKQHIAELEAFKNRTLAKDRYLLQGMTVELAEKAALAELEGDMDSLSAIQKQHSDSMLRKEREKFLANRPDINAGTGKPQLTKEQFAKMGPVERSSLKRENPQEYERLKNLS